MHHSSLRSATIVALGVLAVLGFVLAPVFAPSLSLGPALAQQASFICTEVIGFSQTEQWYDAGFISSIPNPGNWQLRWYSGGSVDFWADPNFAGWGSASLVSHCSQNSSTPDRVVMNVSGDYNSDPNWWAQQTAQVIQNVRSKYAQHRSIALQPVVGGPGGSLCPTSDPAASLPWVRATYNYPYIKQGLAMDVGAEVVLGASPEVRTCADYRDWAGHLNPDAAQAVGASVAGFWASGASGGTAPTATPTSTPTAPPAATSTPLPGGRQVVNFDDLSNPNRPLSGQYPSGLIDWGNTAWWLSGPYGRFSTNSVSFNGPSPTSASFTFLSPRRPVQVDASNGGNASSTVSIGCNGTLSNSASIGAGQAITLASNLASTCTTVTLTSSNGWATNFDNFLVDSGPPTSTPTPTRVPTNTPTSTRVPAGTATATPTQPVGSSSGTQGVVSFDDLSNPNRPLTGQYGGVDWGGGNWWLSAPYAQFSTNSISFNGTSLRSASVTLPTPMRLIQLDADNGGTTTTTISLSCPGQVTVQVNLAPAQESTISTNWTGACSSITFSSSNGWDTNFDNLTFAGSSASATATRTPTPLATNTPTPTPTPRTITFDDLASPNRALNGQYPTGVVDWGTNVWYLSGPYGSFNTNSISFNGTSPTSAVFTLPSPRTLLSMDVVNGGTTSSTVSIACAGLPTVSVRLAENQRATIATGWTTPCTTITLGSTNGWYTNFDNIVMR